jgi:hypothetical protein
LSGRAASTYEKKGKGLGGTVVEAMAQNVATIDRDVWMMIDERDSRAIEEELEHGAGSAAYVYSFRPSGATKDVAGISAVGARELASQYGGIRQTILSTTTKTGSLFIMKSYPRDGVPQSLFVQHIEALKDEDDFHEVLVEVEDVKTGYRTQAEAKEYRIEKRSRRAIAENPNLPEEYERQHYQKIALAKAFRNGTLAVIPQGEQIKWRERMLRLNKSQTITVSEIDQRRDGVLRYAASKGIAVDRGAVDELSYAQIAGLGEAAREGNIEAFTRSARALDILVEREAPPAPKTNGKAAATPRITQQAPPQQRRQERAAAPPPAQQPPEPEEEQTEAGAEDSDAPAEGIMGFDENGDPVTDQNGDEIVFDTPVQFAEWYVAALKASANPDALRQTNLDYGSLEEAKKDPEAWAIIEPPAPSAAKERPKPAAQPPAAEDDGEAKPPYRTHIPVPMGPNSPFRYISSCEKALAACASADEANEWKRINHPTYSTHKAAERIETLFKQRLGQFEAPADEAMKRTQSWINQLRNLGDRDEYNAIANNPSLRNHITYIRSNRHDDLFRMFDAVDIETRQRLGFPMPKAAPTTAQEEPPPREGEHE